MFKQELNDLIYRQRRKISLIWWNNLSKKDKKQQLTGDLTLKNLTDDDIEKLFFKE